MGIGLATVASQAISGIGNINKNAKKGSKFASGGILSGASHANGGIQTPYGELEGGEAVINKNSTARYGSILSALNVAGGGSSFGGGGILGTEANGTASFINYDLLASKVAQANLSLPSPVVSVAEINSAGKRVAVVENSASF